jgi:hypothetical protein
MKRLCNRALPKEITGTSLRVADNIFSHDARLHPTTEQAKHVLEYEMVSDELRD